MYIKQILSILLFFVTQLTFAQSPKLIKTETQKYRADETKWDGSRREYFEYDGDLLTKYTYQIKYSLPNKFVNSRAFEYTYDDNDKLVLKLEYDYTSAEAQVQNFYWDEYFYDSKGCLIALKDSVSSIHGVYNQNYFEYINDENCNPIEEIKHSLTPSGKENLYKTLNFYNESNLLIKDSLIWWEEDHWRTLEVFDYQYDSEERLIEKRRTFYGSFSITIEYEQWDYDENGELTRYIQWREKPNNTVQLISKDSFAIEYDYKNRVIKKQEYQTRFQNMNPTKYYSYEYFCEDILKLTYEDDLPRIYRTFYEYDIGFDEECEEDIEDSSIKINPNPSNGQIQIISNLLGAESATIRVFDTSGKEFYKETVRDLKSQISLDLSFLKRGLYLISIQTGKKIQTEKVCIF